MANPHRPVFSFSSRGALRSIDAGPIRISLTEASELSRTGANLYLRADGASTPLLGASAPGRFVATHDAFEARGTFQGLDYRVVLQRAAGAQSWRWWVHVTNRLTHPARLDLLHVQDVGLKAGGAGLVNEYYVSQYLERRVLEDPAYGSVVVCRQNMKEAGGHPWLMLACADRAASASTDGVQLYGRAFRLHGEPEALRAERLAGELAGESSIVALAAQPFVLAPAASRATAFVAAYLPDHADASSEADLARLPDLVRSFPQVGPEDASRALAAPLRSYLDDAQPLPVDDLTDAELTQHFGDARRHVEVDGDVLLSFFTEGPRHVVLRAKEARVDRPHGHIVQAGASWAPDERVMSTTAFACGVFNSHLTQGNTNFGTLLAVCTNPVLPAPDAGQRILVRRGGRNFLLGVPSAFEMGLNHCRWVYKHEDLVLQVRTWTDPDAPRVHLDVQVRAGAPVALTVLHHFDPSSGWSVLPGATNELVVRPRAGTPIAEKFPAAQFRIVVQGSAAGHRVVDDGASQLTLEVGETRAFGLSFVGEVTQAAVAPPIDDADAQFGADCARAAALSDALHRGLTLRGPRDVEPIDTILPWYGLNALIHYLTPYGLEQFSGAAWGTRDVCQGPVDLLLSEEKYDEARQVLRIVFSHQDPDGGWPQWWMFDSHRAVRADSAHGDVVYWCVLALCSYVRASGDFAFLDEALPWFGDTGATPLVEHVDRIFALVTDSFVPGTALVRFGGGDWNDSLQPVSKDLAERLISSWTVQMCYQAFREYREVCQRAGHAERARALDEIAGRILTDFHRHLVKDDVVAGYGLVGADGSIDVLLHPTDATTGVRYSLLPMNRGVISGVFSRAQAERHLALIEQHLKGPDGARLMDRPLRYHGGLQTLFQRAESSTYFGREIGLMYVHEHLRYAETQARMGRPDAFLRALRQAIPVAYAEVVPQGTPRQANCYYSSSDVVFRSRYEADARYDEVIAGTLPLTGGWRVYSSGPGIYVAMVITRLLGLRIEFGQVVLDPVLPRALDGLEATLRFRGRPVTFAYRVEGPGFGPRSVTVNGTAVAFDRAPDAYREGGAVLQLDRFVALLGADLNRVEVVV